MEISTSLIVSIVATVFGAIGAIPAILLIVRKINENKRWREYKIQELRDLCCSSDDDPEKDPVKLVSSDRYIPAVGIDGNNKRPHNLMDEDDIINSRDSKPLVNRLLDDFKEGKKKRYLILGGSGMGKSTFSVSLFYNYVMTNKKDTARPLHLFYMGKSNVIEKITKKKTELGDKAEQAIIILDAFDENIQAINDREAFWKELEEVTDEFKFVVITCRTQFFHNEDNERGESDVPQFGDPLKYKIFYISPFTQEESKRYLELKYGIGSNKYVKACQIIDNKTKDLQSRPLILSFMDDLLDANFGENASPAQFYDAIIEGWLKREQKINKTPIEAHYDFSKKLADYIYRRRKINGGFFLPEQDFDEFCRLNNFENNQNFSERSLINRMSDGSKKFAHKSFLEYFIALNAIEAPRRSYNGCDFPLAKTFAKEIIAYKLKRKYDIVIPQKDNTFSYVNIERKTQQLSYQDLVTIVEKAKKEIKSTKNVKSQKRVYYTALNEIWLKIVRPVTINSPYGCYKYNNEQSIQNLQLLLRHTLVALILKQILDFFVQSNEDYVERINLIGTKLQELNNGLANNNKTIYFERIQAILANNSNVLESISSLGEHPLSEAFESQTTNKDFVLPNYKEFLLLTDNIRVINFDRTTIDAIALGNSFLKDNYICSSLNAILTMDKYYPTIIIYSDVTTFEDLCIFINKLKETIEPLKEIPYLIVDAVVEKKNILFVINKLLNLPEEQIEPCLSNMFNYRKEI